MLHAHIALRRRHQGTCAICADGEEGERVYQLSTRSTVWRGTFGYDGLLICSKHIKVSCFVTHEACDESYSRRSSSSHSRSTTPVPDSRR